jgi:hypothetical protein
VVFTCSELSPPPQVPPVESSYSGASAHFTTALGTGAGQEPSNTHNKTKAHDGVFACWRSPHSETVLFPGRFSRAQTPSFCKTFELQS